MNQPNFHLNVVTSEGNQAEIHIEPLEKGFGHTLGNALRRVLLTSLSGAAATQVKIDGVNHQFTTLAGLQENIVDFILNLKGVNFELDSDKPVQVKLAHKGKGEIKASDIECPAGVRVINPDHYLGALSSDSAKLNATITVESGIGYSPAEEHATAEIGVIPVDAIFTPVLSVNYTVEATRVGRHTDLDKIRMTIETNGTVAPQKAVEDASRILVSYFTQVYEPSFEESAPTANFNNPLFDQSVEELELPTRVTNALKKGGYKKLGDFSTITLSDLMKVKNLGEKTVTEIINSLKKKGIKVE